MFAKATPIFLAFLAIAAPALADGYAKITASGGTNFTITRDPRYGSDPITEINALSGQKWTVNLPDGQHSACDLRGENTGDDTTFSFTAGPAFLHPCGPNNGLTVVCVGPESTC
ncbi:hypothetical protein IAT38_006285 [Cryptococcus sp. DSM 104549]